MGRFVKLHSYFTLQKEPKKKLDTSIKKIETRYSYNKLDTSFSGLFILLVSFGQNVMDFSSKSSSDSWSGNH
jgi:uncharacterized membrane protein